VGLGKPDDGLAATPPLGWNSWNRFNAKIDETIVRETAEAMVATGMRDAGYRYVVIDDGWEADERDADGDLVADPAKFPNGIRAVAEHVHALGLRFGIYTDAGTKTCQGLPASLGYEFRDARRFAEWGVDYVKVDWCHTNGLGPRALYAKWALAVAATRRPIVLSICEWGRARPWEWAPSLGHLWRTCWDIQDTWASLTAVIDRQAPLHRYAGPGHWNDPDMLEIGNGGLTATEQISQMSLWSMLAAPLIAGNDLRQMSEATRTTLTNPEVIAIDQDRLGRQGGRVRAKHGHEVWARRLAGGDSAIVLLNRTKRAATIRARLQDLPDVRHAPRYVVRDLWAHTTQRTQGAVVATLHPHAVAMYRIHPLRPPGHPHRRRRR
jgi:alpha-galactosidase